MSQGAFPRDPIVAPAPAGRPQRWQNFAPAEREAPQPMQVAGPREAPQLEQNFPLAGVPQVGQGVVSIGRAK